DLHVEVPRVPFDESSARPASGETAEVLPLIRAARQRQLARAGQLNARLPDGLLWRTARAEPDAIGVLKRAVNQWQLSMRSGVRIMKVARTIADLDGRERVAAADVPERLRRRLLDRPIWRRPRDEPPVVRGRRRRPNRAGSAGSRVSLLSDTL